MGRSTITPWERWHPCRRTVGRGTRRQGCQRCQETPLGQFQRTAFAERGLAKCLQAVADSVRQGEVQAVVGELVKSQRAAHLEAKPSANEQERNMVERM